MVHRRGYGAVVAPVQVDDAFRIPEILNGNLRNENHRMLALHASRDVLMLYPCGAATDSVKILDIVRLTPVLDAPLRPKVDQSNFCSWERLWGVVRGVNLDHRLRADELAVVLSPRGA